MKRQKRAAERRLNDREAACPFFRSHTGGAIGCESPIPGSCLRLLFRGQKSKERHYSNWCCANYKYCEIYRMNAQNYEEDE